MWNSAWLEDVKWSFDATTESDRGELRDWNVEKTNYSDWTSANDGAEELYDAVAAAVGDNYPAGYLLFRHFVDELEDDSRMEFYVNHLSSECGEASGKVADEQRRDGGDEEEDDRDKYYYRPRLETVLEETEEELARDRGDEYASLSSGSDDSVDTTSSSSEHWKWGNGWLNGSDDDASTVIDVHLGEFSAPVEFSPQQQRGSYGFHEPAPFDVDFELSMSDAEEDAVQVPVKRRRTEDSSGDLSRAPSLTDSLAQFELLERQINEADDGATQDVVFRTSATSAPFEDCERVRRDSDALSVNSQVFFDCREHPSTPIQLLETSSDACSDVFVDPVEEPLKTLDDDEDMVWHQDDYLHSDMEEYDSDTEQEDDEDEAMDRIQTLGFFSRSHRMRSFRSYGDGLNRLTADDAALNSNSSNSSNSSSSSSSDRSSLSPQDCSSPETPPESGPVRSSAEALSEDSGYGDVGSEPAKKNNEPLLELPSGPGEQAAMCGPDARADGPRWFPASLVPLSAILVRRQPRTRSPLSVAEAEAFASNEEAVDSPARGTDESGSGRPAPICIDLGRTSDVKETAGVASGPSAASAGDDTRPAAPDLDASNFKRAGWEDGKEEEGTQDRPDRSGSCYTRAAAGRGVRDQSLPDVGRVESDNDRLTCSPAAMESAFYPQPVVLKRYGPHQEVEVYITSQKTDDDEPAQTHRLQVTPSAVRGVHFSPVVSAVNWRESYLDPSDSDEDSVKKFAREEVESEGERCDAHDESPAPVTPVPVAPSIEAVPERAADAEVRQEARDGADDARKHNGAAKKPALFQRFSLSRLSARMSATFGRSSGGEASNKSASKRGADRAGDNQSQAAVEAGHSSKRDALGKKQKKMAPTEAAPVAAKLSKIDEFKKEPKRRGFFKQFYRSASSPPAIKSPKTASKVDKPDKADRAPDKVDRAAQAGTAPRHTGAPVEQRREEAGVSAQTACEAKDASPVHAKPPRPPRSVAKKSYLEVPASPVVSNAGLEVALEHFKESARMERERLVNSVPELAAPDDAGEPLASSSPRPFSDCIDREAASGDAPAPRHLSRLPPRPPTGSAPSRERARQAAISRASSVQDAWNATVSRAVLNLSRRNIASSQPAPARGGGGREPGGPVVGLLETDIDVAASDETNLDELIQSLQKFCTLPSGGNGVAAGGTGSSSSSSSGADKRFKSMLNLGCSSSAPASVEPHINVTMTEAGSLAARGLPDPNRAKSMEFLLDEDNKSAVQVPENQLKKCGERQMSEHELRIQRSLQKLNVPEWYRNNARPALSCAPSPSVTDGPGGAPSGTGILRRREYGSSSLRSGGWSGLRNPMATSMTSLGSELSRSATPTRVVVPTRVRAEWKGVKSSSETLSAEPSSLPAPGSGQPFARWASARSSYGACPSPSPSAASTASYRSTLLHQHGRTPYLGWRSQERLNAAPAPLSVYQSPAERLASSLLSVKKPDAKGGPAPDARDEDGVRSSIRQVTSAIVHYVTGDGASSSTSSTPRPSRNGLSSSPERHPLEALSRSPSPRRQRCVWVESSFVGDSGEPSSSASPSSYRAESPPRLANNGRPAGLSLEDNSKKEATLDDVLSSLLGLSTSGKSPSRSPLGPPPVNRMRHEPIEDLKLTAT